jgi:galactitol-specific phosphotransferase system IIC component
MASIGEITVNVKDELIHDALKDFAEKVYEETGIKLQNVDFGWYDSYCSKGYLLQVRINSSK